MKVNTQKEIAPAHDINDSIHHKIYSEFNGINAQSAGILELIRLIPDQFNTFLINDGQTPIELEGLNQIRSKSAELLIELRHVATEEFKVRGLSEITSDTKLWLQEMCDQSGIDSAVLPDNEKLSSFISNFYNVSIDQIVETESSNSNKSHLSKFFQKLQTELNTSENVVTDTGHIVYNVIDDRRFNSSISKNFSSSIAKYGLPAGLAGLFSAGAFWMLNIETSARGVLGTDIEGSVHILGADIPLKQVGYGFAVAINGIQFFIGQRLIKEASEGNKFTINLHNPVKSVQEWINKNKIEIDPQEILVAGVVASAVLFSYGYETFTTFKGLPDIFPALQDQKFVNTCLTFLASFMPDIFLPLSWEAIKEGKSRRQASKSLGSIHLPPGIGS